MLGKLWSNLSPGSWEKATFISRISLGVTSMRTSIILSKLILCLKFYILPVKVADLWDEDKNWDVQKLNSLFVEKIVHKILQVPVMQANTEDKLSWKHTKNGECNTKSAYKEVYKSEHQNTQQVDSQSIALNKVSQKDKSIPPKVKVFAWRLLRGALPSALRLNHRIKDISEGCCRCGMPESDFHLFFSCPFIRLTWMISGCRTDFDRFPINSHVALIIAFVINNDPNKTNLSRLLIVMWQLWKARNDLKFHGIFKEPSQVCFLADAMINSYSQILSQPVLQDDVQSEACKRKMDSIPNGIRCYLDATWDNGRTGIGIFFHFSHNHTVIFIKATSDKAHSSLQAKLLALQLSLEIAIFLNFAGVTFLNHRRHDYEEKFHGRPRRLELKTLFLFKSSMFFPLIDLLQVRWIPREINKMAGKLAKEAKSSPRRGLAHICQNIAHLAYPERSCYAKQLNDCFRSSNCMLNYVLCL